MGKKSTPLSIRDQVYEAVKEEILANRYAPGEELQIDKLAADFGVSTTPIREALIRLSNSGLVLLNPNRGARVSPIRSEDIHHIFELRLLLEPYAARQTTALFPDLDLDDIESRLRQMRPGGCPPAEYRDMDFRVHETLFVRLPNLLLQETMRNLYQRSIRIRYFAQEGKELRQDIVQAAVDEHLAIVAAMKRGDGALAEEAVRVHLVRSEERTLGAVSGRVPVA